MLKTSNSRPQVRITIDILQNRRLQPYLVNRVSDICLKLCQAFSTNSRVNPEAFSQWPYHRLWQYSILYVIGLSSWCCMWTLKWMVIFVSSFLHIVPRPELLKGYYQFIPKIQRSVLQIKILGESSHISCVFKKDKKESEKNFLNNYKLLFVRKGL